MPENGFDIRYCYAGYAEFRRVAKAEFFCAMYGGAAALAHMQDFAKAYDMGGEL